MKKFLLTFMLIFPLLFVTACIPNPFADLKEALNDFKDDSTDASMLKRLKNDTWSSGTLELKDSWLLAEAEVDRWESETVESYKPGFFGFMGNLFTGKGWTQKQQIEWYQDEARGKANRHRALLNASMESDDILRTRDTKDDGIPWLLILGVGAVAIIVILLMKFTKKKVPESQVIVQPAQQPQLVDLSSQRMGFDREKSCKRICEELGLNYEKELNQRNGDVVKLLDDLYTQKGY